jgi:hypothetical protein
VQHWVTLVARGVRYGTRVQKKARRSGPSLGGIHELDVTLHPTCALFDTAHDEPRLRPCHCAQCSPVTVAYTPAVAYDDELLHPEKPAGVRHDAWKARLGDYAAALALYRKSHGQT